MKNQVIFFFIFLLLCGCDQKPTKPPEGSNLYWSYGFTAPLNYQADIASVTAFIGKDQELKLMTGGSTGGYPDGNDGDYFEPDTAPSTMYQSATIEPPKAILVNWYSMQEGQYYAALIKLDNKIRTSMIKSYQAKCVNNMDWYMNNIMIGLAPGGYTRAWLRGPCQDLIDIGHFKGWKVDSDISSGYKEDKNSEYMQRYRERMKEVINKPIPYDNWK
jgi:hypothetical protein